jgi:phenylpropionate dioxygenase-like ring-hydroxylating dioxygenase large terminal subunit
MPNEPAESNFKHKIRTTAYPCREAGGIIWAYMGPKDRLPDFPQQEFTLVPEDQRAVGKVLVECNYLQGMEGECDNSHVGFLHRLLAGGLPPQPKQRLQKHSLSPYLGRDTAPRAILDETDYGIRFAWRRNVDEEHYHYHINQWLMPFQTMIATPPGETIMTIIRPPRDDETSWSFVVHWNPVRPLNIEEREWLRNGGLHMVQTIPGTFRPVANKENDFLIDRALQRSYSFSGIPTPIYNQDFAMTINMGPIVDRTKEHLGTADGVLIAIRRKLRRLAKDLEQGIEPYALQHGEVFRVRPVDVLLPKSAPIDEGAKDFLSARADRIEV